MTINDWEKQITRSEREHVDWSENYRRILTDNEKLAEELQRLTLEEQSR